MMKNGLNVFSVANESYADFFLLFAHSAMHHNEDTRVSIALPEDRLVPYREIDVLQSLFPDRKRCTVTVSDHLKKGSAISPGACRWIIDPLNHPDEDYLYISDIDIITLDDIRDLHVPYMQTTGLPYSNAVRRYTGKNRMTGLHFTEYSALHPMTSEWLQDIDLTIYDEDVLYCIIDKKGYGFPSDYYRPVPGIHISPNREPRDSKNKRGEAIPGWGIEGYEQKWLGYRCSDGFEKIYHLLSDRVKICIDKIDKVVNENIAMCDQR